MTYFGFLIRFLIVPIVFLGTWLWLQRNAYPARQEPWRGPQALLVIALHVLLALAYTTPWDNYLVATGVWWYDPALVTGLTIGWVPIEEYTFFVLQPILSSLLLLNLMPLLRPPATEKRVANSRLRRTLVVVAGLVWLLSLLPLLLSWQPGTYLALELGWALPPIMLQLLYGADLLWHYRRPVFLAISIPTAFLAAADALAIEIGVWTINPQQSLHLLVAGILPLEEILFFLLTNTLIVFGVTLSLAPESRARLGALLQHAKKVRSQGGGSNLGHSASERFSSLRPTHSRKRARRQAEL